MKNLSLFFSLLIIFSVSHKGSSQTVNGVPITPEMIEEYKKSQNSSTNAQQSPSPTKTNNQENSDVRPSDINNILTDTITILDTIYLDKPIQESLEPKKIKIYGHDLYENNLINIIEGNFDQVPKDGYILGIGDKVSVTIWGNSSYSGSYFIESDGSIRPADYMAKIQLAGLKYIDAKKSLIKYFHNYFSFQNDEISINISYTRDVIVNIAGEVKKSGSYKLNGINSAINALALSGGPNEIGSVRKIQLLRSEEKIREIDLYKYLGNPSYADNFQIKDYDFIYVPTSEIIVEIAGGVNRPSRYEIINGEYLNDVIELSGGFSSNAAYNKIQINRFNGLEKEILDIPITQLKSNIILKNGDIITVPIIKDETIENYVKVVGSIKYPGVYQIKENEKIYNVLKQVSPNKKADLKGIYVKRKNKDGSTSFKKLNGLSILENINSPENINLVFNDEIEIVELPEYRKYHQYEIDGAVAKPDTFDYYYGITLNDAIELAGGRNITASNLIYIKRLNDDLSYSSIRVDYSEQNANDIQLLPSDVINILDKKYFENKFNYYISGSVKYPGEYNYLDSLSIQDIIVKAGGFTIDADNYKIEITSTDLNSEDFQLKTVSIDRNLQIAKDKIYIKPYDQIFVRKSTNFELPSRVTIAGEVEYPGEYAILNHSERISDLLIRAGGITKVAFPEGAKLERRNDSTYQETIVLLDKIINNYNSKYNYYLKPGDVLIIPKKQDFVKLNGKIAFIEDRVDSLKNNIDVPFSGRKSAKYYINHYGAGFTKDSKRNRTKVIYANGSIKRAKSILFIKKYPIVNEGSEVFVPAKPPKKEKIYSETPKERISVMNVLKETIAVATGALTLLILSQRID